MITQVLSVAEKILDLLNNKNKSLNLKSKKAGVLDSRPNSNKMFKKLLESKEIVIVGVSRQSLINQFIEFVPTNISSARSKNIKFLIAGNEAYTGLIDSIERQSNRELILDNITNVMNLSKCKQDYMLDSLHIKMHLYANSCTIVRLDDTMFVTPYTHLQGSDSPTFVLDVKRNSDTFNHYMEYIDKLDREAIKVDSADDIKSFLQKIEVKKAELGLRSTSGVKMTEV